MFTPQRKVWSGWSLSPKGANQANGSGVKFSDGGKGKDVVNTVGGEPAILLLGANRVADDSSDLRDKVTQLEKELEKSLCEMRVEYAEIKFIADQDTSVEVNGMGRQGKLQRMTSAGAIRRGKE